MRDPFMREALFSVIPIFVNWSIEAPRMIATNSAGVTTHMLVRLELRDTASQNLVVECRRRQ